MVISFLVRVPVLSEQITVVEPSVSTLDNFFTTALRSASLPTPRLSATEIWAGSPCGTQAAAMLMPNRMDSSMVRRMFSD